MRSSQLLDLLARQTMKELLGCLRTVSGKMAKPTLSLSANFPADVSGIRTRKEISNRVRWPPRRVITLRTHSLLTRSCRESKACALPVESTLLRR